MKKLIIKWLIDLHEKLREKEWARNANKTLEGLYLRYFGWFRGNAPLRIIGDSIAASLLMINDRFGACENQGIPGEKTEGMLFRFALAIKGKPKKLACSIGGNDLRDNVPVSDVVGRIFQMVERARSAGAEFGWIEPPALGPAFADLNLKVPVLISAVEIENARRQLKGLPTLTIIRVRKEAQGSDGYIKPEYFGDGIHPNYMCLSIVYFSAINSFFQA